MTPRSPRARLLQVLSAAALLAAPLAAAAEGYPPPFEGGPPSGPSYRGFGGPPDSALLPAPPENAPPGVCYAHVRAPGEAQPAPPRMVGAHWRLSPPPPGAIGPVWCLVPDYAAAPPPVMREGWIRVDCVSGRPPSPPPPPPCRPCERRRPVRLEDGWLSWHGKQYF